MAEFNPDLAIPVGAPAHFENITAEDKQRVIDEFGVTDVEAKPFDPSKAIPISGKAPAKEGLLERAKQIVTAPYEGKKPVEIPGFWETLVSGPTEGVKTLFKAAVRQATPPGLRDDKDYSNWELLKLVNLYPPAALTNAISAGIGKKVYEETGSPGWAAAADWLSNIIAPHVMSQAGKIPAVARRLEYKAAPALTTMPKAEEIERVGAEVAPKAKTVEEFGTEFKYPLYPEKTEPGGFYREAQRAGREESALRYGRPAILAEGVNVSGEEVAGSLRDFVKQAGISVKVAPTKAERFAKKAAQVLDPISEEQEAYQTVKNMTAAELQEGISGRSSMKDVYRYLLKRSEETSLPGTGYRAPSTESRAKEALAELAKSGDITLDKEMSLNELIGLRQRLNGAKRATTGNDALFRQFEDMRKRVDDIIGKAAPKVRDSLREADVWYASEYLPAFGPKGALRKMTARDAGLIVDELVPKGKKFEVAERMIPKLKPEAREALQSAWIDNLFKESRNAVTNEVEAGAIFKNYNNYSDRTKWALLGGKKPQMDDLMKTIQQAEKDRLKMKLGHVAMYGGSMGTALFASLALKDLIEYQFTGNKRLIAYAGADLYRAGLIYSLTRPQVMSRLIATKQGGMNLLKSFVKVSPTDPAFGPLSINLANALKKTADEMKAEEQAEQ